MANIKIKTIDPSGKVIETTLPEGTQIEVTPDVQSGAIFKIECFLECLKMKCDKGLVATKYGDHKVYVATPVRR